MSAVGPESQVTDSDGGKYTLKKELGKGVEARTFKATVEHATRSNKTLHVGDAVAVKVLNPADNDTTAVARVREQKVLEREGTLLAKKLPKPKDEDQQSYMVVPIFPGVTLQKAMYEVSKETGIGNKRDLPAEVKDGFAVSLLLDQYALQLCGIVHCDLKSDNILADPESKTAKLIDMGEGFIAAEGNFSTTYRGPGAIFEAPETREPNGYKIHLNSFKTDLYSLGAIIAAMYTDKNYERNAPRPNNVNLTIAARNYIDDITGPNVTHKDGMPDGILKVVQSLLTVDPAARPASIALAQGVDQHPGLQAIVQAHQALTQFKNTELKADVTKISGDRHISQEFKDKLNMIVNSNPDLPTMRVKLAELCKEFPDEKTGVKQVTALGEKIDNTCIHEARNIQAIRVNLLAEQAVKEGQQMYVGSVKGLAEMLDAKAKQHKTGAENTERKSMVFGSKAPVTATQLDDVGKVLLVTARTIAAMHEPIDPGQVDLALNGLKKAIESIPKDKFGAEGETAKQKLVSDVEKMQKMHSTAKDLMPKVEPVRPGTPTPMRNSK